MDSVLLLLFPEAVGGIFREIWETWLTSIYWAVAVCMVVFLNGIADFII